MTRVPVKSSNMKSIGYDEPTRTLEIEFANGGVYQHHDVPPEVHSNLLNHPVDASHGKHHSIHIRGKYRFTKIS